MPKSPAPAQTTKAGRARIDSRPVVAGIVTALVGFTSSFAVVLAGLKAVGADPAQAASGLLALTLAVGLGVLVLAWRSRVPLTLAWSTPGAALLAASVVPDGGWPAAVGAFLGAGLLLALTGMVPALGRLMARIPFTSALCPPRKCRIETPRSQPAMLALMNSAAGAWHQVAIM